MLRAEAPCTRVECYSAASVSVHAAVVEIAQQQYTIGCRSKRHHSCGDRSSFTPTFGLARSASGALPDRCMKAYSTLQRTKHGRIRTLLHSSKCRSRAPRREHRSVQRYVGLQSADGHYTPLHTPGRHTRPRSCFSTQGCQLLRHTTTAQRTCDLPTELYCTE